MIFKTISVIGLGYIGLPTAATLASKKLRVIGVDVNEQTVDTINQGKVHIVEPELDTVVEVAVSEGFLKAVLAPEPADAFIIAVPTPLKSLVNNGDIPEPDLHYIKLAAKAIAPVLKKGNLVILESTSPVGTTDQLARWLAEARTDLTFPQSHGEISDIRVAYCPERVLPGRVVKELIENDRIVGGMTSECSRTAIELYKTFVQGECCVTNARTAEMVKLTENSCRDVQIAFANELSIICDKLDINVWELISLANRHPRIGILQPGPGVGGHCIAVDPWFIVAKTPNQAQLIHTARKVNDAKPQWVVDKVKMAIADFLQANTDKSAKDVTIACYGLAFKPNIDDLRESPALSITLQIANMHAGRTLAVEPNITSLPGTIDNIELTNLKHALQHADINLMLVDHDEFVNVKVNSSYVIDTKGIWQLEP